MRILIQLLALEHFNWELFDHSPYNPDLTPSDHHQFTYLKNRQCRIKEGRDLLR
jgi:hypothetical protein